MWAVFSHYRDGAHCPTQVEEIPWNLAPEVMEYARIMKGTEIYMIDQYTREVENLKIIQQEDEAVYGEDGEWAKQAAASIEVRIETVKGMGNPKGYGSDIFADTFRGRE